jgi:hypothetical protein
MALKEVNDNYANPLARASQRHGGWSQPEGGYPAYIHEGRIINVNFVNWTIDFQSQFDQKQFFDVQVSSPYMHPNHGEGIYVMPEINSKCLVCIPSDGPPPFVLAFIMPMETKDVPPEEQTSSATASEGSTFAGGRKRAKSGDIIVKGRDGNFVILHRGGVLQVGASEVAQRIYIPLQNIITDISQNYEHHNSGGSINWGIASSSTDDNPETEFRQTFRLFANDEKADVRLAVGKVRQPLPEPAGDSGSVSLYGETVGGSSDNIAVELGVVPQGFDAGTGALEDLAQGGTKLKLVFSELGGVFLRAEGKVGLRIKQKLQLDLDDDMNVNAKGFVRFNSEKQIDLRAKNGMNISTEKGVISFNGGSKPIATVGSTVNVIVSAPIPIIIGAPPGGTPGVITAGAVLQGQVASGNPTLLG